MIHESLDRVQSISGSSNRVFGFVFACVFAMVGAYPVLFGEAGRTWSFAVAMVFAMLAIVAPRTLSPLNRAWTRIGLVLHKIMNPIVLGVMFFLVVTPIGLLMRALGKRTLSLQMDPEARTYWIERKPPGPSAESFKDQF